MTLNITDGGNSDQIAVVASAVQNAAGTIDTYHGEAGKVGIDALVPPALAWKMLSEAHKASGLRVDQVREGGKVAIDVQVPASVAEKMLDAAEQFGASVRR